jgi:hypothetical protein
MATTWEIMLDSDGLAPTEASESTFTEEDYDELHASGEMETEYFEYLSSSRKLPSAQWGLDSTRDEATQAEWY